MARGTNDTSNNQTQTDLDTNAVTTPPPNLQHSKGSWWPSRGLIAQENKPAVPQTATSSDGAIADNKIAAVTKDLGWMRRKTQKFSAAMPETPYLLAGAFGGPYFINF